MKTPKLNYSKPGAKTTGFLQIGLIFSLGITLVGFEYANADITSSKVTTSKINNLQDEVVYDDFEVEKPKVPQENIPEERRTSTSTNTTTNQQVSTNIQTTTNQNQVTTNVGLPGDSVVIVDFTNTTPIVAEPIYDFVQEMPTYKEFVKMKDLDKRKKETELQLLKNLYKTIKYPEMARQTGVQGKVWVQFIVNKDGEISDVEILRGVHSDLDNEAIRAVKTLPNMVPGKQMDKPVKVRYKIPVEFKLKN